MVDSGGSGVASCLPFSMSSSATSHMRTWPCTVLRGYEDSRSVYSARLLYIIRIDLKREGREGEW